MIPHRMKNPDSVLPLTHLSESLLCRKYPLPCAAFVNCSHQISVFAVVSRHQIAILPQAIKLLN